MKIAIFTDVLLEIPGGIGSSIGAAKKALEAAGHEVLVFAPGWKLPPEERIILIPTLKFLRPGGAPWARRPKTVAKWIRRHHPEIADFDLFHAHYEGPASLAAIELAREFKKPLIQTLHGREDQALAYNIPPLLQPIISSLLLSLHVKTLKRINQSYPKPGSVSKTLILDKRLAPNKGRARMWRVIVGQGNAADLVISPSQHFADKLHKMGLKSPIKILPTGIDDDIIPLDPQLHQWNPDQPLRILWNSRLSKEKRFLPFLEALKIAGEKGLKYEVIAYGGGNELKNAQKFVKTHHLHVHFMGPTSRSQILRASTHSHISVIASYDFDTQGLILPEAEVCGTPVLICDPDMVTSLAPGSFVLTKTPEPLEIAETLLSLTPAKIASMSGHMLAHRSHVYQSSRLAELLEIYKSLI